MHHTQTHIFLPRKIKKNKERGKFNPGKKRKEKKNVSSLLLLEGKGIQVQSKIDTTKRRVKI
jgi:hypothetical protein